MKIEALELEMVESDDDVINLKNENKVVPKQRNIFCLIVKRLYNNITQLHLDCEIGKGPHKMILPLLELKEDEIDVECYRCALVVSTNDSMSDAYKVGLEKIEEYSKSKENKNVMKNILTE